MRKLISRTLVVAMICMLVAIALTRLTRSAHATPTPGTGMMVGPTSRPAQVRGTDLNGISHALSDNPTIRAAGLVFISTECPISNKYVPELNRIAAAAPANAKLYGVISDPTVTRAKAVEFAREYKLAFPVLFDASGELASRLQPATTPEAFVLDREGTVQYRGRIDDTWADLNKQRANPQHHDLADAILAVATGKPVAQAKTMATGCVFEAWKDSDTPAKVTFNRDIAPIFNANCVTCHHAGEVAPFTLTSYDDAAKHAKQIAKVTGRRIMPPWKAEEGFGHFVDERRLTDREVTLIRTWADNGAPEGNPADLPPARQFKDGWTLGEPDMVVSMPATFAIPAGGRDVYRAFVLPLNLPEDRYVVGFEFKPGATTVLHHALFFLDDKGAARKLEAASTDGKPGYRSSGGPGFTPSGGMGGWAPGATPFLLPDGVGRPVHKGADLVMQVHYHPDGKDRVDQSKVAIYFAKKPIVKRVMGWPLMNTQIDIPAGDSHYVRTASITAPFDVTLFGVTPHMHLIGKQMKVTATKPDGTVIPLINVKDWDFRWQDQYRFVDPIQLPRGTVVNMEAVYDNSENNTDNPSSPPKRIKRGEQTTDEMCICFLQMTIDAQNLSTGTGTGKPGAGGFLKRLFGGAK